MTYFSSITRMSTVKAYFCNASFYPPPPPSPPLNPYTVTHAWENQVSPNHTNFQKFKFYWTHLWKCLRKREIHVSPTFCFIFFFWFCAAVFIKDINYINKLSRLVLLHFSQGWYNPSHAGLCDFSAEWR